MASNERRVRGARAGAVDKRFRRLDEEVEVVLEQLREKLRGLERIRGWPEDVDVVVVGRDLARGILALESRAFSTYNGLAMSRCGAGASPFPSSNHAEA